MTIALAIWLIFKSVLLIAFAVLLAALAFCMAVGGILSAGEDAPRWLCPGLLGIALFSTVACVLAMAGVAQTVLTA